MDLSFTKHRILSAPAFFRFFSRCYLTLNCCTNNDNVCAKRAVDFYQNHCQFECSELGTRAFCAANEGAKGYIDALDKSGVDIRCGVRCSDDSGTKRIGTNARRIG